MSVASEIQRLQAAKADIKTAIEGKGVTVPAATKLDGYADLVGQISGGGGDVEEDYSDDVVFIDYDGKKLYGYTKTEFLALTEMPANPSHEGLTAQGWNWTLADAKTYVTNYGMNVIGQMYITSDGLHKIHISLTDANHLSISCSTSNCTTLNWGDGTSENITSSSGNYSYTHTYAQIGDYVISFNGGMNGHPIQAPTDAELELPYYYDVVKKIFMKDGVTSLGSYHFQNYTKLEEVTLSPTITSFGGGATFTGCTNLKAAVFPKDTSTLGASTLSRCINLRIFSFGQSATLSTSSPVSYCNNLEVLCLPPNTTSVWALALYSVKRIVIPNSVTTLANNQFQYCFCLEKYVMSNSITTIPQYCFDQCYALYSISFPTSTTSIGQRAFQSLRVRTLTLPSTITSIGNYCFYQNTYIYEVHCLATAPPTIGTGIFQGASALTHIYVPADKVETYKGASGWSAYADKIEAEPTT